MPRALSPEQLLVPPHPAHLMRSGLLSSLPRCSRPRVQAKMLAMGLVLVGRPCTERAVSCVHTMPWATWHRQLTGSAHWQSTPTFWCSR